MVPDKGWLAGEGPPQVASVLFWMALGSHFFFILPPFSCMKRVIQPKHTLPPYAPTLPRRR